MTTKSGLWILALLGAVPAASFAQDRKETIRWNQGKITKKNLLCENTWKSTPVTVVYTFPLGSVKGHCCATCNEGGACDDCGGGCVQSCVKHKDKGKHYLEIGFKTVSTFARQASKMVSQNYGIKADIPVEGVTVGVNSSTSGSSTSSSSSSGSLTSDGKIPVGTEDHVGPKTCWKVKGEAVLVVTLSLSMNEYWWTFIGTLKHTKSHSLVLPPVVGIGVKNDVTEKKCKCPANVKTGADKKHGRKDSGSGSVPLGFENALYVPSVFPTTTTVTVGQKDRSFPASSNVTVRQEGDRTTATDLVTGSVVKF